MDAFSDSVMIALLPTTSDWCKIELPHMTLVYAGKISDLKPTDQNEMGKVALNLAMACKPMTLVVMRTEVFGDSEEPVDVLVLKTEPQLEAMRAQVEEWNASEHPFSPHATIGPEGSAAEVDIPDSLTFDRIAVGWGPSLMTFKLV